MSNTYLVKKASYQEMAEKVITGTDSLEIVSTEGGVMEVNWVWSTSSSVHTNTSWIIVTTINLGLCKLEVFDKVL